MDRLRLVLIQMDVIPGDWRANIASALMYLEAASNLQADLCVFPEMWSTGLRLDKLFLKLAKDSYLPTMDYLSKWARRFHFFILAGSLPEVEGDRIFNTSFLFSPEGMIQGSYRKIHLFPPFLEPDCFTPGEEPLALDTPWGKIGVLICFDLRFPSEFAILRKKGARIVLVPAQFPDPRLNHWTILLRARAIENQYFVAGCNRVGEDPPRQGFFGHSMIVDPGGDILMQGREEKTLVAVDLDLSRTEEARREFAWLPKDSQ